MYMHCHLCDQEKVYQIKNFYGFIKKNQTKIITIDEKLFHLTDCDQKSKHIYINKYQKALRVPYYKGKTFQNPSWYGEEFVQKD